jgi:hypothetical protein
MAKGKVLSTLNIKAHKSLALVLFFKQSISDKEKERYLLN